MLTDKIVDFGAGIMESIQSSLPQWQTGFDGQQLRQIMEIVSGWNNWIPVQETVICLGFAFSVWLAFQAVNAVKEGAKWLLELIPG